MPQLHPIDSLLSQCIQAVGSKSISGWIPLASVAVHSNEGPNSGKI